MPESYQSHSPGVPESPKRDSTQSYLGLGNPIGFFLTGGEAHDLVGADHLLPTMEADTLIADKAFDADARVLEPLAAAGKTAVIPPRPPLCQTSCRPDRIIIPWGAGRRTWHDTGRGSKTM